MTRQGTRFVIQEAAKARLSLHQHRVLADHGLRLRLADSLLSELVLPARFRVSQK
jgi:hypothetical protein